jgi:hypothetical protein
MTNNEKKMLLALGKSLVRQMDLTLEMMKLLPDEKAVHLKPFYEKMEAELDVFVALAGKEWGGNDED